MLCSFVCMAFNSSWSLSSPINGNNVWYYLSLRKLHPALTGIEPATVGILMQCSITYLAYTDKTRSRWDCMSIMVLLFFDCRNPAFKEKQSKFETFWITFENSLELITAYYSILQGFSLAKTSVWYFILIDMC